MEARKRDEMRAGEGNGERTSICDLESLVVVLFFLYSSWNCSSRCTKSLSEIIFSPVALWKRGGGGGLSWSVGGIVTLMALKKRKVLNLFPLLVIGFGREDRLVGRAG